MAELPQELIDAIETLVEQKYDELIRANKLDVGMTDEDIQTWEEEQMLPYDGEERITQGFFRKFLDWLKQTYVNNTVIVNSEEVLATVKYITPVDYVPPPDCGKLIVPFANLVLEGTGVQPTIPTIPATTPDSAAFDQSSDLMIGGWAYNKTDDKWFYRGSTAIYELKECLDLEVSDVNGLTEALAAKVPAEAGKGFTENDLTDVMKALYDAAYAHSLLTDIHLEPDGTTIEIDGNNKLAVIASAIISLFSADLPLAIDANGNITLAIDDTYLEIVAGKLHVKPQGLASATKLTFNAGTNILAVDEFGTDSVDLSSLGGGGAVDLSNYVKKTGEAAQTIQGNVDITGETESFA